MSGGGGRQDRNKGSTSESPSILSKTLLAIHRDTSRLRNCLSVPFTFSSWIGRINFCPRSSSSGWIVLDTELLIRSMGKAFFSFLLSQRDISKSCTSMEFFLFFFLLDCVIRWRKETSFYLYKLILRNRVTSLQSICKYIWKFFSLAEFSSCELLFPKQENGGNLLFSTRRGIRNKRGDESKRKLIRPAYIDWVGDRIVRGKQGFVETMESDVVTSGSLNV